MKNSTINDGSQKLVVRIAKAILFQIPFAMIKHFTLFIVALIVFAIAMKNDEML